MKLKAMIIATILTATASTVMADCAYKNTTEVKILATGFEAWKVMTEAMAECGRVTAELSQEADQKQASGLAAEPSLYELAGVHHHRDCQSLAIDLDELIWLKVIAKGSNQII